MQVYVLRKFVRGNQFLVQRVVHLGAGQQKVDIKSRR
jgi:hypothetical protein